MDTEENAELNTACIRYEKLFNTMCDERGVFDLKERDTIRYNFITYSLCEFSDNEHKNCMDLMFKIYSYMKISQIKNGMHDVSKLLNKIAEQCFNNELKS
jgi:hypothetical protein